MLKKIVEFLAALLPKVKKLIAPLHSTVVELDSDPVIKAGKLKIKSYVVNYVEKYGPSDFVMLVSASLAALAAFLLCLFLFGALFI